MQCLVFWNQVLLDRSGFYAATSSSDKSLALYDFDIGECVAGMVGHSGNSSRLLFFAMSFSCPQDFYLLILEIVTGLQFSLDCERLITVSGDG
jgi:WD40 repeat protein